MVGENKNNRKRKNTARQQPFYLFIGKIIYLMTSLSRLKALFLDRTLVLDALNNDVQYKIKNAKSTVG